MKFGICFDPKGGRPIPPCTDYIELSALYVDSLDKDAFGKLKNDVNSGAIKTGSCNGLIPSDLRLTGTDVSISKIKEYCERVFSKLAEVKISMLTFGSGAAKRVPDGFSMDKAWDQLFEIGSIFSSVAKQYGQTIAVEPLAYNEVNIVNTVEDGAFYVRTVDQSNFKLLVDFYHLDYNREDFSTIEKNKDLIVHTHFASQKERCVPHTDADWIFFENCVRALKSVGYNGSMSFEGSWLENISIDDMLVKMKDIEKNI